MSEKYTELFPAVRAPSQPESRADEKSFLRISQTDKHAGWEWHNFEYSPTRLFVALRRKYVGLMGPV